jgi:hypothetical protein
MGAQRATFLPKNATSGLERFLNFFHKSHYLDRLHWLFVARAGAIITTQSQKVANFWGLTARVECFRVWRTFGCF